MKQTIAINPPLTRQEHDAVQRCCALIRERQVTAGTAKGALRVATNTAETSLWIEHYFALEAVLALLAASHDLTPVRDYLAFYAEDALAQPQGIAHNLEGPLANPQHLTRRKNEKGDWENKDFDSIDSYAALYLLACARYAKRTGPLPPRIFEAALRSLKALEKVIHQKAKVVKEANETWTFTPEAAHSGLPIARGEYPFQQLMDAIEVYGGLSEASALFAQGQRIDVAQQAKHLAQGVALGIKHFGPDREQASYAFKLDNGNNPSYDNQPYPGDLANLFALAYLPDEPADIRRQIWKRLSTKSPSPQAPPEHWLIAAARREPQGARVKALRQQVVRQVEGFGPDTYIDRLAYTVLALVGGSALLPQLPR